MVYISFVSVPLFILFYMCVYIVIFKFILAHEIQESGSTEIYIYIYIYIYIHIYFSKVN